MRIVAGSTSLHPNRLTAPKVSLLRFGEEAPKAQAAGPQKAGRMKFKLRHLFMLTSVAATGAAIVHNHHKFADDPQKSHLFLQRHWEEGDVSREFYSFQYDFQSIRFPDLRSITTPEIMHYQNSDAYLSLKTDDQQIKSYAYPLSPTNIQELYERYLTRPDSEYTLEHHGDGPSEFDLSLEAIQSLKMQFPSYAKAVNGKRYPMSQEDFSQLADLYRFFLHIEPQIDDIGFSGQTLKDIESVLAKHAEKSRLPWVKIFVCRDLMLHLEDLKQTNHAIWKNYYQEAGLDALAFAVALGCCLAPNIHQRIKQAKRKPV